MGILLDEVVEHMQMVVGKPAIAEAWLAKLQRERLAQGPSRYSPLSASVKETIEYAAGHLFSLAGELRDLGHQELAEDSEDVASALRKINYEDEHPEVT